MSPVFLVLGFLLTLIVSLAIYFWLSEYLNLRDALNFIPGPKSWIFIGHSRLIAAIPEEDRFKWLNDLCFQYGLGMVVIWLGMKPFLHIRKPQQIEIILRSGTIVTKSKTYKILRSWLGKGLLTANGEKWYIHRHVVRLGFEPDVFEPYLVVINKKTDILIKQIEAKLRTNSKSAIVNIFSLAVKYSFDTACEIAMGMDMDTLRKSDNVYTRAINIFCQMATKRYLEPWVTSDFIFYKQKVGRKMLKTVKILHDFTENALKQKQAELKEKKETTDEGSGATKKSGGDSYLDHVLKKNIGFERPLTFQELRDELDTFLFVDYNTISTAISWALFAIGNAPGVQAKLHEELTAVLNKNNNNRPATMEQLMKLQYMDRVIKEVLRLYPSVPIIGRSLDKHAVIDNYFVPRGTTVNICIYQLHRDPEIWEDPEMFDPDRYLPENSNERHPYAYIPFSSGPRRCMGDNLALLEIKIVLAAILRKWRVSSLLKPSEIKMTSSFTLKPSDNRIEVIFTPINKH